METSDAGTRAGYALLSILLILSWVFAGLRFYIRLVRRNAGWDDTFIFLSVVSLFSSLSLFCSIVFVFGHFADFSLLVMLFSIYSVFLWTCGKRPRRRY